ncbi:hypothetical protein Pelo_5080 [Pelomyxa schiedti]|nr:hypothetical protein Pelo_5080 [Pelomyxa schiedti]
MCCEGGGGGGGGGEEQGGSPGGNSAGVVWRVTNGTVCLQPRHAIGKPFAENVEEEQYIAHATWWLREKKGSSEIVKPLLLVLTNLHYFALTQQASGNYKKLWVRDLQNVVRVSHNNGNDTIDIYYRTKGEVLTKTLSLEVGEDPDEPDQGFIWQVAMTCLSRNVNQAFFEGTYVSELYQYHLYGCATDGVNLKLHHRCIVISTKNLYCLKAKAPGQPNIKSLLWKVPLSSLKSVSTAEDAPYIVILSFYSTELHPFVFIASDSEESSVLATELRRMIICRIPCTFYIKKILLFKSMSKMFMYQMGKYQRVHHNDDIVHAYKKCSFLLADVFP